MFQILIFELLNTMALSAYLPKALNLSFLHMLSKYTATAKNSQHIKVPTFR